MKRIFDLRMADGSRNFADLPQSHDCYEVRDHIHTLPGARLTGFVCDDVTEAWIDFDYGLYSFSINDQHGDYWFFVDDPACPHSVLEEVLAYWEQLLVPAQAPAER